MPDLPLFQAYAKSQQKIPLAERLRPQTLTDVLGQAQVLGPDKPLWNLIKKQQLTSLLLWGPPGVGKTTLARLIALAVDARFIELSAVQSGIKELREQIDAAQLALAGGRQTVLFIDEIHRYSKTQQDALLPWVENGLLTLIGATTENPAFQVIPALMSRTLLVRLEALQPADMLALLKKAVAAEYSLAAIMPDAERYLVHYGNGDARAMLNLLEAVMACLPENTPLTQDFIQALVPHHLATHSEDDHYDVASAYQKSLRGSDANAAIYWLAKFLASGEDPRFIARRLVVTAAEDVGLAAPMALVLAEAAAQALDRLGLPEGRIPLAEATIYVANAPKSNAAICAVDAALADIQQHGQNHPVPPHLKDSHYKLARDLGYGKSYLYTHDHPDTPQAFLPEPLIGKQYVAKPEVYLPDDVILASTSPRRRELLRELGLKFRIVEPYVEESTVDVSALPVHDQVRTLARYKGEAVADRFPNALVISADTLVARTTKQDMQLIFGKPRDEQDAKHMLSMLQDNSHEVWTGVAVFYKGKSAVAVEKTVVWIKAMTDLQQWQYIHTREPLDKAGSYAIQGCGSLLVEKIDGCYFNVVGLPLHRLSVIAQDLNISIQHLCQLTV